MKRAGIPCRYRPVPSLPGVPAIMLGLRDRYALIEFEDSGTLTTPEGYLRKDYHWRRQRWVPITHITERKGLQWETVGPPSEN